MSNTTKVENEVGTSSSKSAYWAANLRLIKICLVVWFTVSFGFAILLRPMISGIEFAGTDLGFWFAQQGSILFFLAIIFTYSIKMNKIDKEHSVDE
ncbi:MAG: DUF4212 domain-containing protein [Micavibrio sp.]|nr:DUF4212 domain-containing protein [Micavibrio sp.]